MYTYITIKNTRWRALAIFLTVKKTVIGKNLKIG